MHGSILDPAAIDDATRGADLLIHLAGIVGMRLAKTERQRALSVSVDGTELLLARTPPIPTVLASSSAVYGLIQLSAAEECMGGPDERAMEYDGGVAGYATGKWRMEITPRRSTHLMCGGRSLSGSGRSAPVGMVLPSFVERARADEELVVHNDGQQSRSFSYVGTFVDALVRAISIPASWELPDRALNVGAPTATSILDLARLVIARTNELVHRSRALRVCFSE